MVHLEIGAPRKSSEFSRLRNLVMTLEGIKERTTSCDFVASLYVFCTSSKLSLSTMRCEMHL
eukprot:767873-Hanusia_phi.AAC.3